VELVTTADLKKLRAAFPAAEIGKLPKPTKKENPKGRCDVCGGYHGLPAIHLDYVGHAAVTDRLLSVDPAYEFGPVLDINKRPIKDGDSVLHYLTVCGATRYEWGDGPNMKEISSDAIRRCAMRFGVALDLWAKEPLAGDTDETAAGSRNTGDKAPSGSGAASSTSPPPARRRTPPRGKKLELLNAAKDAGVDDDLRHRVTRMFTGKESVYDLSSDECDKVIKQLAWLSAHRSSALEALANWEAENGLA